MAHYTATINVKCGCGLHRISQHLNEHIMLRIILYNLSYFSTCHIKHSKIPWNGNECQYSMLHSLLHVNISFYSLQVCLAVDNISKR